MNTEVVTPIKKKDKFDPDYTFYCPGCKCEHGIWTTHVNKRGAIWTIKGDLFKPTITPSFLINSNSKDRCHSVIKDGEITYLTDSKHELKGQTIKMCSI